MLLKLIIFRHDLKAPLHCFTQFLFWSRRKRFLEIQSPPLRLILMLTISLDRWQRIDAVYEVYFKRMLLLFFLRMLLWIIYWSKFSCLSEVTIKWIFRVLRHIIAFIFLFISERLSKTDREDFPDKKMLLKLPLRDFSVEKMIFYNNIQLL